MYHVLPEIVGSGTIMSIVGKVWICFATVIIIENVETVGKPTKV